MGFFIRKSKRLGPLRLNVSKHGVGVSAGVKGLRISKNSKRTTIYGGRGGAYYRKTIGKGKGRGAKRDDEAGGCGGCGCAAMLALAALAFLLLLGWM